MRYSFVRSIFIYILYINIFKINKLCKFSNFYWVAKPCNFCAGLVALVQGL